MGPLRFASLVFLVLLLVDPAAADSDGYYCVGRDYLAYQFGMAPLPIAPHRLYVIRLGGEQDVGEPAGIELPQFQVHGLLCGEKTVQVWAFDALYTVYLDQSRWPVRYDSIRSGDGQRPIFTGRRQSSLGGFGFTIKGLATQRKPLMKDASGHEFVIEIGPKPTGSDRCHPEITTRLLELSASGKTLRERVLYRGTAFLASAPCIH